MTSRRRILSLALALIGAWLAVGLFTAGQLAVMPVLDGAAAPGVDGPLDRILAALVWVPVTAAVVALALRYPVDARNWRRRVPLHLAASGALSFVVNLLQGVVFRTVDGGGWDTLLAGTLAGGVRWLHINALLYWVIVGVALGVRHVRRAHEHRLALARLEADLARARLDALKAQLHPHFLFNTLHTVGQLSRLGRGDEASDMVERLSGLLRGVLDTRAEQEVSLARELEFVRDYLAIEAVRIGERLEVRWEIEDDTAEVAIPVFSLQLLAENAIRHGVEADSSAGRVTVRARLAAGALLLEVEDDGPGLDGDPGRGLGLDNLRQRLRHLYGPDGRLEVLDVPGGALARVRVPIGEPARREALT